MNWLLNLIFPKRCVGCRTIGSYLCNQCLLEIEPLVLQYCAGCKFVSKGGLTHARCKAKTRLNGIQSLVYYEGHVRKLIQKIKYKGAYSIVEEVLPKFLEKVTLDFEPDLTLVPVPLSRQRQSSRGFNQAEVFARELAGIYREKVVINWLTRVRDTQTQTKLARADRLENLKGAFQASDIVKGKKILLIDDVWTTGATLNEAAKELKKKGAKQVYAFTIAVGK